MEPRVLRIDLGALARGGGVARAVPALQGPESFLATLGGSALGLALLSAHARRSSDEALVIAVGEAVRAGLPTAARAAVLARAPLSGLYAEGHVGGTLGARLARVADALLLTGHAGAPGAVLVLAESGARLLARPELGGRAPAEIARALESELGPAAVLATGPAGLRGLPFASLAVGHAPPSFVGRGGLGAVLARLGLVAVVVRAEPVRAAPRGAAAALVERLSASPRLAERAAGGTLELFETTARHDERAHALAAEARARADERHGCRGCPTPCGWVFERSDGARQGARFGASQALGPALGLATLDDALFLLSRCDALGLDAKEAGAVLALECTARERGLLPGPSPRGDRAALAARLDALVDPALPDPAVPGRAGAARLAAALGLADEVPTSRGQAIRPEPSLAALLGQCVASGGTDPMRSFPFLLESGSRARLAALLAPLPVPPEALDPRAPRAKGRLVFWHENLVTAVDVSGFCAFSAAGLLLDGQCELDELAAWILPASLRDPEEPAWRALAPSQRLLAAGASVVLARHALNERYAARAPVALDPPAFARAALAAPGMLDEYQALRGLDAGSRLTAAARAALGSSGVLTLGPGLPDADSTPTTASHAAATHGRITVRTSGALAEALGASLTLDVHFPTTVAGALAGAAPDSSARALLFHQDALLPSVWRHGQRLAAEDEVRPGDVLDLVTAISGG